MTKDEDTSPFKPFDRGSRVILLDALSELIKMHESKIKYLQNWPEELTITQERRDREIEYSLRVVKHARRLSSQLVGLTLDPTLIG